MSANMTQGEKSHQGGLPRPTLIGAACLVLLSLGAVAFGRATDIGVSHMEARNVVATRDVNFMDRSDGGVDVIDAVSGQPIDVVQPGTNGFLRGTLRGLARQRRLSDIGAEPPFRLTRWSDGTFSLEDRGTGQRIALEAFGPTNAAVFARLLTLRGTTP